MSSDDLQSMALMVTVSSEVFISCLPPSRINRHLWILIPETEDDASCLAMISIPCNYLLSKFYKRRSESIYSTLQLQQLSVLVSPKAESDQEWLQNDSQRLFISYQ